MVRFSGTSNLIAAMQVSSYLKDGKRLEATPDPAKKPRPKARQKGKRNNPSTRPKRSHTNARGPSKTVRRVSTEEKKMTFKT
jgi:hypothetical protein